MSLDPGLGEAAVGVFDCLQLPTPGASVAITPSNAAVIAYQRNGVFDPQATTTDATGTAAILNVTPGPFQVSVTLAATGQIVSRANAFARAQTLTQIATAPLPP